MFNVSGLTIPMFLVERVKTVLSADSMSATASKRRSTVLMIVNGPTLTCEIDSSIGDKCKNIIISI